MTRAPKKRDIHDLWVSLTRYAIAAVIILGLIGWIGNWAFLVAAVFLVASSIWQYAYLGMGKSSQNKKNQDSEV